METFPTSSWSRRTRTCRAVSFVPSLPASGEVLMPITTDSEGSSTVITGSGRGSSRSASVSPIVMSGSPATAMISPAPASSTGTRSSASVTNSSLTVARSTRPSVRHQATGWPARIVPVAHAAQREATEIRATRRGS